jgi:riboflavin kinase/FMN adenylyltransferase
MKVYRNIEEFKGVDFPVVTSGTFDGVHLGHQTVIRRLKEIAQQNRGESVLLTFYPHPRMVLFPEEEGIRMLNSQEEKISLLEKQGVDHLIIYPFSKQFSRLSSVQFIRDVLVNQIKTKKLVIGYNHHFGRNREGSFLHLKEYGPVYGFEVEEIPAKDMDSIEISSTKIRHSLEDGNIKAANAFLGYSYPFSGRVVKGKQLGRQLGYPTANLMPLDPYKLIPGNGVYVVSVNHKGDLYRGMLNIGVNPTVGGELRTIEVHVLDFNKDIYGETLELHFIDKIRNEQKFDSIEKLKLQLGKDREHTLNENLTLRIE